MTKAIQLMNYLLSLLDALISLGMDCDPRSLVVDKLLFDIT